MESGAQTARRSLQVPGQVSFALTHPQALRSIVMGWAPAHWARRHAPAWDTTNATPNPQTQTKEHKDKCK